MAHRLAALDGDPDRAQAVFLGLFRAVQDPVILDDLAIAPPAHADAADLRVQGAAMHARPPQWQAVAEQPPAQLVDQFHAALDLRAFGQQPAVDPAAENWRAQTAIGALDAKEFLAPRRGRESQRLFGIHRHDISQRRAMKASGNSCR